MLITTFLGRTRRSEAALPIVGLFSPQLISSEAGAYTRRIEMVAAHESISPNHEALTSISVR